MASLVDVVVDGVDEIKDLDLDLRTGKICESRTEISLMPWLTASPRSMMVVVGEVSVWSRFIVH